VWHTLESSEVFIQSLVTILTLGE